jgi:hypothetical protein
MFVWQTTVQVERNIRYCTNIGLPDLLVERANHVTNVHLGSLIVALDRSCMLNIFAASEWHA